MVLVFFGMSVVPANGVTLRIVAVLVAFVLATGALVGATHGLALIWLLRLRDSTRYAADSAPQWATME